MINERGKRSESSKEMILAALRKVHKIPEVTSTLRPLSGARDPAVFCETESALITQHEDIRSQIELRSQ